MNMILWVVLLVVSGSAFDQNVTRAGLKVKNILEGSQEIKEGASYSVIWNCGQCPINNANYHYCWNFNGGPFHDITIPIDSYYTSCADTGLSYPIKIGFNCQSNCKHKCSISISSGLLGRNLCADTPEGKEVIDLLNEIQQAMEHDSRREEYDWCGHAGCTLASGSNHMMMFIVIGAVILAIVLFFYYKKREQANQVQNQQTPYNSYELMQR